MQGEKLLRCAAPCPCSCSRLSLWVRISQTSFKPKGTSLAPHAAHGQSPRTLFPSSLSGDFGVKAAGGCCFQWQSSLHSEDDRCWVLLPAPLGLPGPAQGPHALMVSPFPLGVPIPAQGPQALKHSAAPFLPAVLKPQNSQKSPFDGWMWSKLLSLLFECPYVYWHFGTKVNYNWLFLNETTNTLFPMFYYFITHHINLIPITIKQSWNELDMYQWGEKEIAGGASQLCGNVYPCGFLRLLLSQKLNIPISYWATALRASERISAPIAEGILLTGSWSAE